MAVSAIQGVTMSTLKTEMESVSPAQALWLQNWEANKWAEVDENGVAGGVFIADPVAVSLPNNKVHCFATGLNSHIYHKWFDPSTTTWSGWVDMGYACVGAPVAIKFATDRVAVFVIGFDRLVRVGMKSTSSDTVYNWEIIGSDTKRIRGGSLSAIPYDGRILIVAVEVATGKLLHSWTEVGQIWKTAWTTLDSSGTTFCTSTPVIVSCKELTVDVFVFGQEYSMKRMTCRYGAGWSNWSDLGGTFLYHPAAISVSLGRIDAFGIGTDSQLYKLSTTITGNEVGTLVWTTLGAASLSSPITTITSPGVFSVTTKKAKGVWQQKFYESSTGVWTPQDGMTVVPSA